MKFGICYCYWSKDWEGNDYPQAIERARKCGFDALEIPWGRTLTMQQPEIDDIVAACKANDVELYITGGFGAAEDVSQADETGRLAAVEKSKRLLEAWGKLGARKFSGINYGAWCKFDHPINKERSFEQAAKSLKEIGKCAADYNIDWNMETVNRFENYMLNTAKEARLLADMVDHPNVKINLDIFHGMIEEDDIVEAVRIAGDKLGHYHMGNNNRKLPAPGFLPWQDIVNAMKEIGYDNSISFEPLVRAGGTVTLEGGSMWRDMLPAGKTEEELDQMLMDSLAYIKGMF